MASQNRFRILLWVAGICGLGFIGRQFFRKEISNPPVTAEVQAPVEVKQVLRHSCYDCHSNETKMAWFDQIEPRHDVAVDDVRVAREHLNFSEIGAAPAAQQRGFLFESVNFIQMGWMPLPQYLLLHWKAAVTPEQLAVLRDYLAVTPPPDSAKAAADASAADAEYGRWVKSGQTAIDVQPEFNGVTFLPDYRNWKAISSTDRFDNHTMRVILGNDVAVRAIAERHINPWPDGTAFAKVAWKQAAADAQGVVRTGEFIQVELMIKDSTRYAASKGWGWGRWRGTDLKPYGKDAKFENECISCHMPLRKNDYVYTLPIGGQQ
jgi:hypothetical protein